MHKLATPLAAVVAFVLAAPLAAGTVVTIDRRDLPDGTPKPMVMHVQGDLIAISGGDDDAHVIFRGDRQQMLVIDDAKKTYLKLDQAMAAGVGRQVDAAMQQAEAAIAELPPEQQAMARRMMEQQMRQRPGQPPTTGQQQATGQQAPVVGGGAVERAAAIADTQRVERTSQTATREGYPCVKYEIYDGLVKTEEMWVTDWSNVRGHAEIQAAMKSMKEYTDQLTASLARLGTSSLGTQGISNWWHGIDGAPVVTTEFTNGSPVRETVVRSVEDQDVAASTFEVPEGYKEQKIGM